MRSTAILTGIVRPVTHGPGFGIPIFTESGNIDGQWLVQYRNCEDELIDDFIPAETIEDVSSFVRKPANKMSVSVETPCLYAFELADGTILIGDKSQLTAELTTRIEEFRNKPFILQDIAEFIGDDELLAQAKQACDTIIQNTKTR